MNDHVYDAIVVGAGYGGVGMAAQFTRAGIDDFLVLERERHVGGVWWKNTYPGAACDTQSHIYCYSFHLNLRVSALFAGRDELLGYVESLVDKFSLASRIRFEIEVIRAEWNEDDALWRLCTGDGETFRARAFVPAWGQLATPTIPEFTGFETFEGESFHSAQWRHDVDLSGKSVASVGAAASAVQYVPEVAKSAQELVVFQRSANYIMPRDQVVFSEDELDAFSADPSLYEASRREIHDMREAGFVRMQHEATEQAEAVGIARRHLESQVSDPELRKKLTPDYEFGCKRVLRTDDFYPALMRPNVVLETDRIREFTEDSIVTDSGTEHRVDVVIFGTGFKSQAFQGDLEVRGRDGQALDERWGTSPEAYLGMTVDGFPNMFLIYGPNTNLNHNSIVTMLEAQQEYIVAAVRHLLADPSGSLEVSRRVLRDYNDWVQSELENSSYSSDCSSWYKNDEGKVINNWCSTVEQYRELTRTLKLDDYLVHEVEASHG